MEQNLVYCSDNVSNEDKVSLMTNIINELNKELRNPVLFESINSQLLDPHPTLTEDEVIEQTVFALLANIKYGLSIDECAKLVNNGESINWCFDKFINTEDFEKAVDNLYTISIGDFKISHTVDINDNNQIASAMMSVIEVFNFELETNSVLSHKMSYAATEAKRLLNIDKDLPSDLMFNVGCAVIAWHYYKQDLDEGIALAIKNESAKKCFELFLMNSYSEIINDVEGKTENTILH